MKSVLSLDPDFEKCVLRIAQAPRLQHAVTPSPSSFSKAILIHGFVAQQASFSILVMEPEAPEQPEHDRQCPGCPTSQRHSEAPVLLSQLGR